jgi:hypothetical protein
MTKAGFRFLFKIYVQELRPKSYCKSYVQNLLVCKKPKRSTRLRREGSLRSWRARRKGSGSPRPVHLAIRSPPFSVSASRRQVTSQSGQPSWRRSRIILSAPCRCRCCVLAAGAVVSCRVAPVGMRD